ncbi:MAG: molybdopterin-containing oxidoreductase family protein [Desulfonatronovibrionaceae bacterium]
MSHSMPLSRRKFLKAGLAAAAAGSAVGSPLVKSLRTRAHAAGSRPDGIPVESHFTACDMCFNRCGMIARVQDGVITKLDPNPKFLKSRGMICARGNAAVQQIYSQDRLKYPLRRTGKRGEGRWERLTWEQALDYAAENLQTIAEKYTRCGVMFTPGSDMQTQFISRFAEVFGSYNITSHETLCLLSKNRAFLDTFGEVPYPDVLHSRYIIIAGANPFEAIITPDTMDFFEARKNGCKIVVLDPRFTKTAALADEWYQIRPGTDMAFFLSLCHVIINEQLYDAEGCCPKRTFGFDDFFQHVQKYSPQWAEKECSIPAEDIVRIAREISSAAPSAMVYPGRRSSDYENSTQIRRAMAITNALLNNFDKPGGLLALREVGVKKPYYDTPWYDDNPFDRVEAGIVPGLIDHEGSFELMREAIISGEPYPIKGWFSFKTNFFQTAANRNKSLEMIEHLDFIMNIDIQMTDTAWYADLVLPGSTFLERKDPVSALQGSSACACAVMRDPVVEEMFESRSPFWICQQLAQRLGLEDSFNFTIDDYRKEQLKGLDGALEVMQEDGVYYNPSKVYGIYAGSPLKTLSGVKEIYNQRYADAGMDPMPVYRQPEPPPEGKFRLVVGRTAFFTHSNTNNELLTEFMEENVLNMHPDAAAALDLQDGQLVEVSSRAGSGRLKLKLTRGIEQKTVYMATGFGSHSPGMSLIYQKGACIADVLEDYYDEISGNMAMHETLVNVRKVA